MQYFHRGAASVQSARGSTVAAVPMNLLFLLAASSVPVWARDLGRQAYESNLCYMAVPIDFAH